MDPMKQLLFFLFFLPSIGWSYPQFIGHNYNSCLNCHYNPFGGGQLTDYGRSVDATLISSKFFYPKLWSDEKIADSSGFLFQKPKQTWFRPQLNYRGFQIVNNPNGTRETKEWITMQQDVRITLKFGENDKFIFSGDYGRIPELSNPPPATDDEKYRSRNLFLGYRLNPKMGIYAGLMDKVYGLRVVEHIAYSRINPMITMNDQTYGVAAHYVDPEWEGGLHGFIGNFNQDIEYRQKGFSGMLEKTIFKSHRLGASLLSSKSDYLTLKSVSVHGRFNFKEGSALLAELGQTDRTTHDNSPSPTTRFGLLQAYVRPVRGLYVLANVDYQHVDLSESAYTVRWGPAVQYFPIQRIELRADIYDTRNFMSQTAAKDSWTYLLQTHIWL
jgi:hypothetical protein